jgi:hypothetical protein
VRRPPRQPLRAGTAARVQCTQQLARCPVGRRARSLWSRSRGVAVAVCASHLRARQPPPAAPTPQPAGVRIASGPCRHRATRTVRCRRTNRNFSIVTQSTSFATNLLSDQEINTATRTRSLIGWKPILAS